MVKNLSTRFSIIGRGSGCHGGRSAVEKSAYISRTTLKSEYDGEKYFPKYSEDLVHTEISLPENAPEEFKDRSVLWNSVEMKETGKNAQLARSLKFSLQNEWSYELAKEVVRTTEFSGASDKYSGSLITVFFDTEEQVMAVAKYSKDNELNLDVKYSKLGENTDVYSSVLERV
mgnify:CR=1 FL=1